AGGAASSRRVPQWVRDRVWERDQGRCSFRAADGRRCGPRAWLEFDHVRPYALGGASDDPANVRLLCRAHNQLRAREMFGEAARRAA
ncbi:MAG: HNH endonuclease, partial [Elusimicrobia bacterium]|nr:HNH endonuclease [Elusimicrobiota bacterium]